MLLYRAERKEAGRAVAVKRGDFGRCEMFQSHR
jgi:hypothetical protein